MGIEKIGPLNNYNRYNKINKSKPMESSKINDSVSISEEALSRAEKNKVLEILSNTPDIRADKIKAIKEKINDPNYINDSIANSVADKIMDSFNI